MGGRGVTSGLLLLAVWACVCEDDIAGLSKKSKEDGEGVKRGVEGSGSIDQGAGWLAGWLRKWKEERGS